MPGTSSPFGPHDWSVLGACERCKVKRSLENQYSSCPGPAMDTLDLLVYYAGILPELREKRAAEIRAGLAKLHDKHGTPTELNGDGQLEVTPEQFAALQRDAAEAPLGSLLPPEPAIPVVVVRPN